MKQIKPRNKYPKIVIIEAYIVTVTFLLFVCVIIAPTFLLNSRCKSVEKLRDPNYYTVKNPTEPTFDNVQKANDLYEYIASSDSTHYTIFHYLYRVYDNGGEFAEAYANEDFFKLQEDNFSLEAGRMFNHDDFDFKMGDTVPILVGYNVRNMYELGETYEVISSGNGTIFKLKVIGVLKKNTTYVWHGLRERIVDDLYIIPMNDNLVENYFGYSNYHMLFSNLGIQVNNPQVINDIISKVNETNVFKLEFKKLDDVITEEKALFKSTFFNRLGKATVVYVLILTIIFVQALIIIRKVHHTQASRKDTT